MNRHVIVIQTKKNLLQRAFKGSWTGLHTQGAGRLYISEFINKQLVKMAQVVRGGMIIGPPASEWCTPWGPVCVCVCVCDYYEYTPLLTEIYPRSFPS